MYRQISSIRRSFRRFALWRLAVLAAMVYTSSAVAGEPLPQEREAPGRAPAKPSRDREQPGRTPLRVPEVKWNPQELKRFILNRLEIWENPPPDPELEATVVQELFGYFGYSDFFPRFDPPAWLNKRLLARRLNYRSWQAREAATIGFGEILRGNPILRDARDGSGWRDDAELLVPILRDALNDLHPKVRFHAVSQMARLLLGIEQKLDVVYGQGRFRSKVNPAERRKWIDLHDEIIDMIMNKGLVDEDLDVRTESIVALDQTDVAYVTAADLRSLDRRIARGLPDDLALEFAKELRAKWTRSEKKEPPGPLRGNSDDPFSIPAR